MPPSSQPAVTLPKKAIGQRDATEKIKIATKNLTEYEQMYAITTNELFKAAFLSKIVAEKKLIKEQEIRLKKLKCHAEAQAKLAAKKAKLLEEGVVEKYDGPGRPSMAMLHQDL